MQAVELPKHQSGSCEVSSHGHYTDRKKGSRRPVTVTTDENLTEVKQLCQSQDNKPGTHKKSQRSEAARISLACHREALRKELECNIEKGSSSF